MRLSLLVIVGLSGCGALFVPSTVDAGPVTPRDAGAVSVDAGVPLRDSGSPEVDAGGSFTPDSGTSGLVDAGTTVTDAGADGGLGAWQASSVGLVVTQGNTVLSLSGRDSEVYAVTDDELFRSTGAAFTDVPLTSLGGSLPSMRSLWVAPDGAVFVLAQRELFTCRSGCPAGGAAFTSFVPSLTDDGVALCGQSSTKVFAVFVNRSTNGVSSLRQYDGATWSPVVNDLALPEPRGCAVMASGAVAITGRGAVVVYGQGTATINHPDNGMLQTNEANTTNWYGATAVGDEVWVGGYSLRSSHRLANGSWAFINDASSSVLFGLSSFGAAEVYAVGGQGRLLRHFEGSSWSVVPASGTVQVARSVFVESPKRIYVGGSNGTKPAIDRFTRD